MKFEALKKTVTMGAFLMLMQAFPSFAQEKTESFEDLVQKAREQEKRVFQEVSKNGRNGKFTQVKIKQLIYSPGEEVIVGYNENGKEKWILRKTDNGKFYFLDENLDGVLDRLILDSREKKERNNVEEDSEKEMLAFVPFDFLSETAETKGNLDPKRIFVYKIIELPDGFEIKCIDFSNGATANQQGEEAEKTTHKIQEIFSLSLEPLPEIK